MVKLGLESQRKNVDKKTLDGYIAKLQPMIDCKTVFKRDGSNDTEFQKFNDVIANNFPLVHKLCEKLVFGSGCFIYKYEGVQSRHNIMLMSHHDVVEATDGWHSDAFHSQIKNGSLYGRGTIDTKTPLFAQLQAMEELLNEGYDFKGLTVYIGSSNNEEVCGDGMVKASDYFKANHIHFDVISDEGGAITSGMIPGFKGKSAMVAVHEKSRHMYLCKTRLLAKGHGGLSLNDDSAIIRLMGFINEINNTRIYHNTFYPEVKATFNDHAPYMSFPMNIVFSHLNVFSPIVKKIMSNIPPAKAMLSTSITFTTINAGNPLDPQIKAKEAECTMFIRCIREDDLEKGMNQIKSVAAKYGVEITLLERDYCQPSRFDSNAFNILKKVMNENFPDVVVAPFLLTAGTDARRFSDVCDNILRFAPIDLDSEQFNSIHGDDEHIKLVNIGQCVCFYKDFIVELGRKL